MNNYDFKLLTYIKNNKNDSILEISKKLDVSNDEIINARKELLNLGYIDNGGITNAGLDFLKPYKVDNAIIMAAGTSSRFAPLSYEIPKGLIEVKGEILIERQIKQLQSVGINNIYIVVGYKKEKFNYLKEKYNVNLIENNEYLTRNNNASIYVVKEILGNSYICSSDNYFSINPFEEYVDDAYYSAVFANGNTNEWCISSDELGYINNVTIGGHNQWFMLGHTYWNREFSKKFVQILEKIYNDDSTKDMLWERIFMANLNQLKMKIRKYKTDEIFEFDTLDELREFDDSYITNTRSQIIKDICNKLDCKEFEISQLKSYKDDNNAASGFEFILKDIKYRYSYKDSKIRRMD